MEAPTRLGKTTPCQQPHNGTAARRHNYGTPASLGWHSGGAPPPPLGTTRGNIPTHRICTEEFHDDVTRSPADCQLYNTYVYMGLQPSEYAWVRAYGPPRHPKTQLRLHNISQHGLPYHPPLLRGRGVQPKMHAGLCGRWANTSHCSEGPACKWQHAPEYLQDCLCRNFLRGVPCCINKDGDIIRRCDHVHGTELNDPTGHQTMHREVRWHTLPDALTRTPHPPKPTDADLQHCPTCVYIPIPTKHICEDTTLTWSDNAYGLTPPPPIFTEYKPNIKVPRLQIALDLLARQSATHRSLPLEASRILMPTLRTIQDLFSPGPNRWCNILDTYDCDQFEFYHGKDHDNITGHRPTRDEFWQYSRQLTDTGHALGELLDRLEIELADRGTTPRPPISNWPGPDDRRRRERRRDRDARHQRQQDDNGTIAE